MSHRAQEGVLAVCHYVRISMGGVGCAAEHLAGHDQAGCLWVGVEQVKAAVVHDRPHRRGLADPDDGRDMLAVAVNSPISGGEF